MGATTSKTRSILLDAAEEMMRENGYAAVTSRKLAAKAGLKPQLVHYYFRTMDDLFVALFQRVAEQLYRRQQLALQSDNPLRAFWELSSDPRGVVLSYEFVALANHRKAIRHEIAEFGEGFRKGQIKLLRQAMTAAAIDTKAWPPSAIAVILELVARGLGLEDALGMSTGHGELTKLIDRLIGQVEA
jgi:AcrR family transcriptional regulator